MAQEVEFGNGAVGKIRSFWVGFGLTILTLGIYYFCWYYFVNDELKDVGIDKDDQNLAHSSPAMSVTAVLFGGIIIVPPLLSVYNYGQRIHRAQRLGGIPRAEQINPVTAFLLYFPGSFLIVPYFIHFWYVTKHQNMAMRAAGGLPYSGDVTGPVATES
jgi:drug/metabolite transporter (DMT)-like permease